MFKLNGVDASETTDKELATILSFYNSKRIIIGHSVVDDISAGYNNKVIKIDVKHGQKMGTGKTKGLFIEKNVFYKVNDLGIKEKLFI